MDYALFVVFKRFQPRGSSNANNGSTTTPTTTTTNNNVASPAPVYLSGFSYTNDAYPSSENFSAATLPKYSREGEDIEMGVLPTYQQATQGASRNGFKNLRYRSRKGPVLAIFSVIMCFLLAGAIWATIKAN